MEKPKTFISESSASCLDTCIHFFEVYCGIMENLDLIKVLKCYNELKYFATFIIRFVIEYHDTVSL